MNNYVLWLIAGLLLLACVWVPKIAPIQRQPWPHTVLPQTQPSPEQPQIDPGLPNQPRFDRPQFRPQDEQPKPQEPNQRFRPG